MFWFGDIKDWPPWANTLTHLNHLFLVINSSSNIIIYVAKVEKHNKTTDLMNIEYCIVWPIWQMDASYTSGVFQLLYAGFPPLWQAPLVALVNDSMTNYPHRVKVHENVKLSLRLT